MVEPVDPALAAVELLAHFLGRHRSLLADREDLEAWAGVVKCPCDTTRIVVCRRCGQMLYGVSETVGDCLHCGELRPRLAALWN